MAQGAFFQGLGHLTGGEFYSQATAVSANGRVVTGYSKRFPGFNGFEAFRWTRRDGMEGLGVLPGGAIYLSWANGISPDSRYIVGGSNGANGHEAFLWSKSKGMVGLGDLPGGPTISAAYDVSEAGRVVVGRSAYNDLGNDEAFRWTAEEGMVGLGFLPGGSRDDSEAYAVSADGTVIVGSSSSSNLREPFRWTAETGMVSLGDLPGGSAYGCATGISDNGRFIVGYSQSAGGREPFLWSAESGMIGLGFLSGDEGLGAALAVSADGRFVIGDSTSDDGSEPFIWEAGVGMRSMNDYLLDYGVDVVGMGWKLQDASAISADGRTIVGQGINPAGDPEAWIAHIPAPSAAWPLVLGVLAARRRRR